MESQKYVDAFVALQQNIESKIHENTSWITKAIAEWEEHSDARLKELAAKADAIESCNQMLKKELRTTTTSHALDNIPLHYTADTLHQLRYGLVWPPGVRALESVLPLRESEPAISDEKHPRIGVFLHIYYADLASEMISCIRSLPETSFIHISTDTETKKNQLSALFAREGLAERSEIRVFPNRGWDIAPFLVGFSEAIGQYDLVLRLHSKRSVQLDEQRGEDWRKMLFTALAGNRNRVQGIVRGFINDPKLGMVCGPILPYYAKSLDFGGNFLRMQSLLHERGVAIRLSTALDFPMGSMFWCRPAALRTWLESSFTFDDFEITKSNERDGSLAHALERLFFFGCGIAGLNWARIPELHQKDISA